MANEIDEKSCHERLTELEEENRFLRSAATRFGELAERLSEELARARRLGADWRHTDRHSNDRRALVNIEKR